MQEAASIWQSALGEIELSISHGNFITWFKNTSVIGFQNNKLTIGVGNVFIKQQLDGKYKSLVHETLTKQGFNPSVIEFKILSSSAKQKNNISSMQDILDDISESALAPQNDTKTSTTKPSRIGPILNKKYTFNNFVVGSGNELAYAACQAVTSSPGTKYNPLFIYGGVGIGKTHLIQAVGNAVLERQPNAKVLYITSEQFLQEFVDAVRFKKNNAFVDHYRNADVLIIDDIQFIAGKEKVQEEFFHTFNALHQANKQIIISSDKPPHAISTLEERLKSRFAWGMSIDMQIPDLETRCAILINKAASSGVDIDSDVAEYLATNMQTNIRELEGALNQVLAFCEMRAIEPSMDVVTSIINSSRTRPKHLSARHIIERTAKYFQISIDEITGPKRDKDIVLPRQIAMYLMRSELHLSFPKIASELGRKDHTTAMHSIEKIEREVHIDSTVKTSISEIKEKLYA